MALELAIVGTLAGIAWFAIQGSDPCARVDRGHDICNDSRNCVRRPPLVNHLDDGDTGDHGSARLSGRNRDACRTRMSDPVPYAMPKQPKSTPNKKSPSAIGQKVRMGRKSQL